MRRKKEQAEYDWKKIVDTKDTDLRRLEKELKRMQQNLPCDVTPPDKYPATVVEMEQLRQANEELQSKLFDAEKDREHALQQLSQGNDRDSSRLEQHDFQLWEPERGIDELQEAYRKLQ